MTCYQRQRCDTAIHPVDDRQQMLANDKNPCIAFTSAICSFADPVTEAKNRTHKLSDILSRCVSQMRNARRHQTPSSPTPSPPPPLSSMVSRFSRLACCSRGYSISPPCLCVSLMVLIFRRALPFTHRQQALVIDKRGISLFSHLFCVSFVFCFRVVRF